QAGDTIVVPSNTQSTFSLLINGVLDLGQTSGHSFGTVSGTGTMKITNDNLQFNIPSGNFNSFGCYATSPQGNPVTSGGTGGTIEYNNWANVPFTLPSNFLTYFNLTVNSTGSGEIDFPASASDLYINGNLNIKKGSFINASAGINDITCYGDLTLSTGGIFDNMTNDFNLYGNLINNSGKNSYKSLSNTNICGFNDQSIKGSKSSTFAYLNLSNSNKYFSDSIFVNNDLSITNSGTTLVDSGNVVNVKGNWSNAGFSTLTGTTIFNNNGAQSVSGNSQTAFQNLILGNGSKSYATTPPSELIVNGNLLINSGGILNIGSVNMHIFGNWTNNNSSAALVSTSNSCVNFEGINQKVLGSSGTNFNYLTFNSSLSSSNDTLSANISVGRDLIFTQGNVITKNQNLVVKGNWINNSSATAFSSVSATDTVILNGSSQNIDGAYPTTFNNLNISNGTKTLNNISYINVMRGMIVETGGLLSYLGKQIYHYGDLTNNGNTTSLGNTGQAGTYILKGVNQTIKGTSPTNFLNLNVDGGGVKT
ncbi:MAG: hypothetical protein Q8880_13700, partial [Bacteroidota bacterium]|nr:hypothetical protein [Bacteroidota bacterium]